MSDVRVAETPHAHFFFEGSTQQRGNTDGTASSQNDARRWGRTSSRLLVPDSGFARVPACAPGGNHQRNKWLGLFCPPACAPGGNLCGRGTAMQFRGSCPCARAKRNHMTRNGSAAASRGVARCLPAVGTDRPQGSSSLPSGGRPGEVPHVPCSPRRAPSLHRAAEPGFCAVRSSG